jgi:hypothetical protein
VGCAPRRRIGCPSISGTGRGFGRPAQLVWGKRRWPCREELCAARTWTETSEHGSTRAVLTRRVGLEACRQVGENARPVDELADELGVCSWTIMGSPR